MRNASKILMEINSWNEFFTYANTLTEKAKGDIFEYLTKLILSTKPEYSSILKNVWIQQEGIPKEIKEKLNLPDTDEGIDIVAETFTGEYWAIQCKFKGQNQTPTYKELSTFGNLSNNYCKNISLALLVHTGEKGVRKKKLLGENYSEIGLDFWLGLTVEDWERIHKYLKGQSIRPKPKHPRPHQQKAIKNATEHFIQKEAHRGRMIMPCGTGKSLTAFWIATALNAKSVIIAVPSLALIKQSLEDWTREFVAHHEEPRPEWLVICSDESTAKLDNSDEFVSDVHSLGIPTTTNIEVIRSFLTNSRGGRKVIFTSYQSSDKLAQASRICKFSFDLAILDEAHKTVGVKSKAFATLLSDYNIAISKRLFMTATERVVRGANEEVYSMDNHAIYGNLFYQLSFKEAIHSDPPIICDYKVLTISVTNDEIKQLIAKNKLIADTSNKLEEQEAQSLAAAIALRKATQKYGISHAISFHRSIIGADDFAKLNTKLNEGNHDSVILNSSHISSKKSAGERAKLLTDFTNEQLALMTNARCLTEGVNVPAIDCVLFADPKQSAIDIVQAAGRALRPSVGKECGYIMLPLIVPENLSFEEFTDSTPFKEVVRVIAALSTQDEGIAEEFRVTNTGRLNGGKRILFEGTVPVGMKLNLNNFADEINAKIWERVAKVNWRPFGEARAFVHKLNLKSRADWNKYLKSGNKPADIPASPEKAYLDKGWIGIGDWLGTGTIATFLREYRSFEHARAFIHELKLKNQDEWRAYYKSSKKPEDIPSNPNIVYADEGWKGMGNWLGTGNIASRLQKFRSFEEARKFASSLRLKKQGEWHKYCKSGNKPSDIPTNPNRAYSNNGWNGWGDWLGTGNVASYLREYYSFEKARLFVHKLKLKSYEEWRQYCMSGSKPEYIPASPEKTYLDKGWRGLGDWQGTGNVANFNKEFRPFEQARAFVRELKLRGQAEWAKYCSSGKRPNDIPTAPHNTYLNNGWISYGDWLGTGTIANQRKKFCSFLEGRIFVHSLGIKTVGQWRDYCTSGNKPNDIPAYPNEIYLNQGWKGFGDWLGTETIATFRREYRSFDDAKIFAHGLKLKNQREWNMYCQMGKKPADIPVAPQNTFKGNGWKSWGDWLGTDNVAPMKRVFCSFEDARIFIHKLKIKNQKEWNKYLQSKAKPEDIPSTPSRTYKDKGWISWGDWLGVKKP